MHVRQILFISSSIGLGHIVRDLAIVRKLRNRSPQLRVQWLAGHPASEYLEAQGEETFTGNRALADMSAAAESAAEDGGLNLFRYVVAVRDAWRQNRAVFQRVIETERFDCVIADEAYELEAFLNRHPEKKQWPFIVLHDFIGIEASGGGLFERLGVWIINRKWIQPKADLSLFVGVPDDIPDERFGIMLPNKREYASNRYRFIGQVIPFDPEDLPPRDILRKELGFGAGPLLVCSAGGTAAGKPLLELCRDTFPFLRRQLPELTMLIAAGPRIDPEDLAVAGVSGNGRPGLQVLPFVPGLYRYFAAADLCIIQAGGMTSAELSVLDIPFFYIPLEGHSEQEQHICEKLRQVECGIPLRFRDVTPRSLAEAVLQKLQYSGCGRALSGNRFRRKAGSDGAARAAEEILGCLNGGGP